jgi:hypothetical protein
VGAEESAGRHGQPRDGNTRTREGFDPIFWGIGGILPSLPAHQSRLCSKSGFVTLAVERRPASYSILRSRSEQRDPGRQSGQPDPYLGPTTEHL